MRLDAQIETITLEENGSDFPIGGTKVMVDFKNPIRRKSRGLTVTEPHDFRFQLAVDENGFPLLEVTVKTDPRYGDGPTPSPCQQRFTIYANGSGSYSFVADNNADLSTMAAPELPKQCQSLADTDTEAAPTDAPVSAPEVGELQAAPIGKDGVKRVQF
jgi:hypothetical protein